MLNSLLKRKALGPAVVLAVGVAFAAPTPTVAVSYVSRGGFVKVEGTSTLHEWEVQSDKIQGQVTVSSGFFDSASEPEADGPTGKVEIPVMSLASGKSRMDKLMHEALKADDHPTIRFELKTASPELDRSATTGVSEIDMQGTLTIAGETREVPMKVKVDRSKAGHLIATGETSLKMTDFGVDPPTAMFGTLKTGDQVNIEFQWDLAIPAEAH